MYTRLISVKIILKKARNKMRELFYKISYACNRNYHCVVIYDEKELSELWPDRGVTCISEEKLAEPKDGIMVSIIVPLYNAEKYIHTCLDSLIKQKTNYRYEIIAINDGSLDKTSEILYEYANKYEFINVITQDNKGISCTRNVGIMNSKGMYIGFIDQDDWVDERYIEKLVSTAETEQADIVKCGFNVWDNGAFFEKISFGNKTIMDGRDELLLQMPSYIWSGIYRRSVFNYIRFPEGYWYEDMIVRLLIYRSSKKLVNLEVGLYNKLYHKNNASSVVWSTKNAQCLEQFYLPKSLIQDNNKLGIDGDVYLYEGVLLEYSRIMVYRIAGLPIDVQKKVFMGCKEVLSSIYKDEYYEQMTPDMKEWNDIFVTNNYRRWKANAYV